MNWVKRKGTTAKRKMNPGFYEKFVFTWEKKIAEAVFEHKIRSNFILNLDQTPLDFASPSKTRYTKRISLNVSIANLDGKFFPIQLIYTGTTDLCHQKVKFPQGFCITHSHNHWSNK